MTAPSPAIVILGMHRSGTSCLAGMLSAAGLASAGEAVRNWDNARGHHEMLDVVRLNEAVLAHSGGHWLSSPPAVRWTDDHARTRDALLAARVDGLPALLKDPRTLLTLPFWRASAIPFHALGIVRHPLAVARSLESWRGTPLVEGVALWTAHNRALAADRAQHAYPLVDFDQERAAVIAAVHRACTELGIATSPSALAAGYDDALVHHDETEPPDVPGLTEAIALHAALLHGRGRSTPRGRGFPHALMESFRAHLAAGQHADATRAARQALAAVADPAAVLVPLVTHLLRARAFTLAHELVDDSAPRIDDGLAALLSGKIALAAGDPTTAVAALERACSMAQPYFQARLLLPQALRAAARPSEARTAMRAIVADALYPHRPLATLAEWSWLDGDRATAITELRAAIDAAPLHRRGRLRTRLAEWLIATGDRDEAREQLERAEIEDPGYPRSREVLATI